MELYKAFRAVLCAGWAFALDAIAPKDPAIKEIEGLGSEGFYNRVLKLRMRGAERDLICLFSYKDPLVKKAILDVKSYGNKTVAKILGKALYETLVEESGERLIIEHFTHPLLVPIPMTSKSVRARGWNQCIILAEALKEYDSADEFDLMPEALLKIRDTEDQVGKGRRERFENLRDCFEADPRVKGRNVIILDDICTTGATLLEARRALLSAGARKVLLIALAR